ncbi:MAG TPA: c-type cytochrome biogenesis protein CcsB [Actinomycetota bacterium]|nr:c-type cytochrome biogenesis protein CcsB [Actinomycetota bacterium]
MSTEQWSRLSTDAFNVALFAYIAGMIGYFYYLAFRGQLAWRAARVAAFLGLSANALSVVSRGVAAGRVPWGNMYEYSSLLALLVVTGYLFVVEGVFKVRVLGGFVLAFSVLTMAIAVMFLYVGPGPLVPALNSYWIKIHVVAAITGSSLFALGSIVTILYLAKDRRERRTAAMTPIAGGSVDLEDAPPHFESGADEPVGEATRWGILPSAAVLDRVAYRTIAFAFPIWTFAVIAGAIWAEQAWGRYWGWDPKETWSFITWVVFAGYLHARATSGWRGRRAAVIALVGFASLLVTYYAVNLWIVGLHSYAR